MPTYEYECEACKQTFEVEQKITEPPLTRCLLSRVGVVPLGSTVAVKPGERFDVVGGIWCGGTVKRLISSRPATFILKGRGWFKDGY